MTNKDEVGRPNQPPNWFVLVTTLLGVFLLLGVLHNFSKAGKNRQVEQDTQIEKAKTDQD